MLLKIINNSILNCYKLNKFNNIESRRHVFEWLNVIFNAPDKNRLNLVGPDRMCAEWLVRNGAAVKWNGLREFTKNYDILAEMKDNDKIELTEIDATNSTINHKGFIHFRGCKHIRQIVFDNCHLLEDKAFPYLINLRDSLEHLQISNCYSVTDKGILSCKDLTNLKMFIVKNVTLKDKENTEREIKLALHRCHIEIS